VVLAHNGAENPSEVAEALVNSGIWRPIFVDPDGYSFLFVKDDSELLEHFRKTGKLDHLRYPSQAAKVLSEAFMYQGVSSTPPNWLKSALRTTARETPTPHMFLALSKLCSDAKGCIDPDTRSYLLAELKRLARIRFAHQAGGYWILRSRLEILRSLERDHEACPGETPSLDFATEAAVVKIAIQSLRKEFFPWGVRWWQLP
jgi:hypothetical protein